jgi:hypothetical protein
MEEGDTITALQAGDRLNELNQERQQEINTQVKVPQGPSDEYLEWIVDNKWYESDEEMHDFADSAALAYVRKNGQTPDKVIFNHVEKQIKKAFPEKFSNPNRNRPGATGKGDVNNKRSGGSRITLSPEQEAIARRWERMEVMTRDQYIKELQNMGDE